MNNFAAFILSNRRAHSVKTVDSLRRCGYTGPIYIVIDNEDPTADQYYERFGDKVIVFNKAEVAKSLDMGINSETRRAATHARKAIFDIANDLGIEYFLELDDDYPEWHYTFSHDYSQCWQRPIRNLDAIFAALVRYYKSAEKITSLAMVQRGELQGGAMNVELRSLTMKRKAMNTFICSTKRPFRFLGRINEDVTTYVRLGSLGYLFLTTYLVGINQLTTQANPGGLTEAYLETGTYVKSFFSVMYSPSSVQIYMIGERHHRIHHRIAWKNAVPCILRERYKKGHGFTKALESATIDT